MVVNDSLPSQFTATEAAGQGSRVRSRAVPAGRWSCTRATLAPTDGTPVQITINGTLAGGTAGQTIADAATVSSDTADPELENNTATFTQLIAPAADLTITKKAYLSNGETPVNNPLSVGETFIYALRVTNNGPSRSDEHGRDRPAADRHHRHGHAPRWMQHKRGRPAPNGHVRDRHAPGR